MLKSRYQSEQILLIFRAKDYSGKAEGLKFSLQVIKETTIDYF